MLDLTPYTPVSAMPAARRDVSVAVSDHVDAELIGDRVRAALGANSRLVEELTVLSTTAGDALPPQARGRLGLRPGQKNMLLRVLLRGLDRTLTSEEANALRDRIFAAVHEGTS